MKKYAFRKLIKLTLEGLIRESEPDDELEGKPFGDDDIWQGSDIGGVKQGGTGFSHGQGYPNNPFRRRGRKMTKDDLRKILFINNLEGVKDEDKEKFGKLCQRLTYQFIKKNAPWIFTYGYKEEYGDKMWYPFAPYFSNQYQSFDYWLNGFSDVVSQQLDSFEHWIKFPKEQLKGAAKYNKHWILRYKWAREMMKQHPTLVQDLSKVKDLIGKLYRYSPDDTTNDKNYPAYVTLYDTTRRLGGHEEGGWWYDDDDMVNSVKVNSYKEARKAVVHLLKTMGSADLNGKPLIVIEKEQGSRGNKPPPSYS